MVAGSGLIGRAVEMASLRAALDADRATVLLGEAGIGKTALVRAVAAGGARTLREGGAFATLRATPYVALRRAVGVGLSGDPATVAARLEGVIGPDLLFVDDAHWADEATLAAVGLLVGRIALVAAVRSLDPGAAQAIAALERAGATIHRLAPLGADAARELVGNRRPDLSRRVVDDIVRRAAGNPLLLEEMAVGGEATPVLSRVMTSRLDQLSAAARGIVELLAVAERPLPRALLADDASEVIDAGVAVESTDGVEVRHQLVAEAVRDRLDEAGRRRLHSIVAEVVDNAAEAARHLAAAGRLEAAANMALGALESVKDVRDRAELLVIAAEASPVKDAFSLRLHAARALDEVSDWPAVSRVLAGAPPGGTAAERTEAEALLAHAAYAMGDVGAARRHIAAADGRDVEPGSPADMRRAIVAATFLVNVDGQVAGAIERLNSVSAAIAADASGAEDVASLRASILLLATGQGDVNRIRAAADAAFDAARFRTATDRARVVQYFLNMFVGCEEALRFLLDRHARYDAAGLGSMAHEFLADAVVAASLGGRLREAVTIADRLLEEPVSTRPRQMASIYRSRALVLLGRIDEAEAALEVLRPSATADFWGLGELFTCLAEAALWGGRPDLARERAEAALAVPAPLPVATIHARLTLAWACRELGLPIEEVDDVALTPSSSAAPIELRAIGAAAAGDDVGAAASFKAAGASWHRFHEPRSLICRWAAGEALGRAGEKSDGIEEIQLALESAQAIGFEPLAARARRSLRLLGVRVSQKSPEPPAHALGLTARERELVSLVERGLTNVEIARRLGLGRPTVARMLGSAMAKLGVTSRAELAAIVPG